MHRDTHCGTLRGQDDGRQVTVAGWVAGRRDHGGLIFIDIRDRSGFLQVVFNPENAPAAHKAAEYLRSEWVVQVRGEVRRRKEGADNPDLPTGEVELVAAVLTVLSRSDTPPFEVDDRTNASEDVRIRYRYLDLRRPVMQKLMRLKHEVTRIIWEHLHREDFMHVETPILLKSTPEGARDYVVPSRVHPGKFYALPQSPQQLKQMLMVAGIERYFQIARCFRDEDLRADRQPEHTQLDLEMSFVHARDVMDTVERLYTRLVRELRPLAKLQDRFECITFEESMKRFGTDKPDLRLGMEMADLTSIAARSGARVFTAALESGGIVKGFAVPGGGSMSRRECDRLVEMAKGLGAKGLVWIAFDREAHISSDLSSDQFRSPIAKFLQPETVRAFAESIKATPGDLALIAAGPEKLTNLALSSLRTEMGASLNIAGPRRFSVCMGHGFSSVRVGRGNLTNGLPLTTFFLPRGRSISKYWRIPLAMCEVSCSTLFAMVGSSVRGPSG